jgi:hypothetical protein
MVLAGVVVALTLVMLMSSARAMAANGVHFDPDSPAGKEYALPLDQARGEATGGGESDEEAAPGAPLFGAGVPPTGPQSAGILGPGGEAADQQANPATKHSASRKSAARSGAVVHISEAGGGGYPPASGVAMVAAIVLLGGVLGLALRGLQRRAVSP